MQAKTKRRLRIIYSEVAEENSYGSACCSEYLTSRHQTTSDTNYWTIHTPFIAISALSLEESAPKVFIKKLF